LDFEREGESLVVHFRFAHGESEFRMFGAV